MKKLILIFTIFILSSCNLSTENKILEKNINIPERDKDIEEYLLSQRTFSWEDTPFSKRVCLFENLWNEDDLFPLSLWVRCSWYRNWEELSWASLVVLLDYPNELSYYDINKFSHKIPADWSGYSNSIRKIFPKEVQEKIFNNTAWSSLSAKIDKIISWEFKDNAVELKSNEQISEENWYYYKSVVAEEKEFTFKKTLEKNNLDYENLNEMNYKFLRWERPICPWMPNKETCIKEGYWAIYNRYSIWDDIYDLIFDSSNKQFQNENKYFIFKNDILIFEDNIEMVWAWSPYKAYEYNWELLFIYTKSKWENTVLYNVFYEGEYINKKYNFDNIDWFYIYKDKEWFIADNTKIFFNWKILQYNFDYIQNTACCTAPSLFKVYENWKLIFANKRGKTIEDLEFDIIELDLNDYLN